MYMPMIAPFVEVGIRPSQQSSPSSPSRRLCPTRRPRL